MALTYVFKSRRTTRMHTLTVNFFRLSMCAQFVSQVWDTRTREQYSQHSTDHRNTNHNCWACGKTIPRKNIPRFDIGLIGWTKDRSNRDAFTQFTWGLNGYYNFNFIYIIITGAAVPFFWGRGTCQRRGMLFPQINCGPPKRVKNVIKLAWPPNPQLSQGSSPATWLSQVT